MMEKEDREILKEINQTLQEINSRQDEAESETSKSLAQSDSRVEYAKTQIQNSLDRIHDKAFNFNTILIGVYLVAGTFPSESPKLNLLTVFFPILNLVYIVIIDIRQMEIHRAAAHEQEWSPIEIAKHGRRISRHALLSLSALLISIACLIYLVIKLA